MSLLQSITHPARIHDIAFCKGPEDQEVLLVAAEDTKVTLYLLPAVETESESSDEDDTAGLHKNPPVIAYLTGHMNR